MNLAALTDRPSVSRCLQQVRFNPERGCFSTMIALSGNYVTVTRAKIVRHTVHYRRCAALALSRVGDDGATALRIRLAT